MLQLETHVDAITRIGRALGDATRCRILLMLADGPNYPAAIAESLGLTRTNVSNHLACLRGCGLVVASPEGRQVRYELAQPQLAHALGDLLDVVLAVNEDERCLPASSSLGVLA
jgi:DNA-binding transcriptional ArsR family regulator